MVTWSIVTDLENWNAPNQSTWTDKQLERFPDGIRQSQASHILLEFKYSQSLDRKAMAQAIFKDHFILNPNS